MANKSDNPGCFTIFFVLLFLGAGAVTFSIPRKPISESTTAENQAHIDRIRGLLREAGNNDIAATGPWTPDLEARFGGFVKLVQQQPDWGAQAGWDFQPEPFWSVEYSKFLAARLQQVNGPAAKAISELKDAADALMKAGILWVPSNSNANALAFWNSAFSGFGDDLFLYLQFRDDPQASEAARADYAATILYGEIHAHQSTRIFMLLGAIFSVGTVLAHMAAGSASSSGQALFLMMGVEFFEWVIYTIGQARTLKDVSLDRDLGQEFVAVLVVGFVIGVWEAARWNRNHR